MTVTSKEESIYLNINYCGSMLKSDDSFEYLGERLFIANVCWKLREITWEKFEDFIAEKNVSAAVAMIWHKLPSEGMEKVQYEIDSAGVGLSLLSDAVKKEGEVDIFIEHECSDMVRGQLEAVYLLEGGNNGNNGNQNEHEAEVRDYGDDENDKVYDAEDEDGSDNGDSEYDEESEDGSYRVEEDELDIPKDDMDVEESETEMDAIGKKKPADVDDGDEVVAEVNDPATDDRFAALIDKAEKTETFREKLVFEEDEREESDVSDGEYIITEEPYLDTPLDTDEEWERLREKPKKKKKSREQFHGDYDEPPYLWLFQKFNSGDEFKSQLLRYALKTQFDVKMAKSNGRRIAAVCCEKNCKWKVYCSVEVPIQKWMVKVCHNIHEHPKSSKVRMLKQSVIASLYREELGRRVYMTANEIKDSIKEHYKIIVSR